MKGMHSTSDRHREAWDLLPWLANESLAGDDARRVEEHLRECETCQVEFHMQRQLRDIIRAEDAVVLAPQASWQKLMQRIELHDECAELDLPDTVVAIGGRPTPAGALRVPRWLAIAAGLQAITIAILLGALWHQSHELENAPRFATVTSPAETHNGPIIRVVFNDRITVGELNELLRSIGGYVVAGPSPAGVYTLALLADAPGQQVADVAAQLRADHRVVFSEPASVEITGR
jgi:hypothetical protein